MAVEEDLSEWEIASNFKMVAYGFGFLTVNALLMLGGVFYFYEVEVGLPVIYVMIAMVLFAIWNMVNDPILGYLTDRPLKWTRKYGLRAPWVKISAYPLLIFFFLIYIPPLGEGAIILFSWFLITSCIFDTFLSIYNEHVYAGYTNQFPSGYERRRAFAIATLLMGAISTSLGIIRLFIIEWGRPETFALSALVTVIILGVLNIFLFIGVRESEEMKKMFISTYEAKDAEEKKFFSVMKTSLKTKNFRVSLLGYTISVTAMQGLWNASGSYMLKDVYGVEPSAAILPTIVGVATFLGSIPFWYNYSRKHGFKKTYYTCFILHGIAFLPFLITQNIIHHTIGIFFLMFIYSGEVVTLMPVASDTFDDVSAKLGMRVDAMLQGIRNFFFRVAFIVVAIVFTVIHLYTAYNPDPAATQTPEAIWGIRVHAALIPAIMYIIMGLIFKKYYTLEGAEKVALVRLLKEKGIYR
jgi:GPH family glycoside/pentoside/hexuronide:cation symporter